MQKTKSNKKAVDVGRRGFVSAAGAIATVASLPQHAFAVTARDAMTMAEDRRDELLQLLVDLVRVRSISGETADAAQAVVARYLEALPYRVERSEDRPSRYLQHAEFMPPNPAGDGPFTNLVGWPQHSGGRQFAMFVAH